MLPSHACPALPVPPPVPLPSCRPDHQVIEADVSLERILRTKLDYVIKSIVKFEVRALPVHLCGYGTCVCMFCVHPSSIKSAMQARSGALPWVC